MVMDLLGKSLNYIFYNDFKYHFDLKTCCTIGIKMLKVLKSIHERGFVHRDLKPGNFCMERGHNDPLKAELYLIDFGVSK